MKPLALVVLLSAAISSARADDPRSNPLSTKEIADGWIALFDGKTTFGWTSPNDSKWTVIDGMMAPQKGKAGVLMTTTTFRDYELSLEFQAKTKNSLRLLVNMDALGEGDAETDEIEIPDPGSGWWTAALRVQGGYVVSQAFSRADKATKSGGGPVTGKKRTIGRVGLKGSNFIVRNVKLKPLDLLPLLNGKDLEGWKEHPGQRSKFSVTKEGWLHVKDGKGDLQTTKHWADFVLQLDCKTNGKHLNSGVFFRCLPGEYQMGYEAQIHNGFGPEKEITLEVFDPKTNKQLEKIKQKTTALDFGTGAIYRRQPARFQTSKDEEWFTMTVVARGRHLATWVNGLQVVDWTDHRPLAENARKGAYLKAGPISLQGHDPTTDLLFRNIRIAELPVK